MNVWVPLLAGALGLTGIASVVYFIRLETFIRAKEQDACPYGEECVACHPTASAATTAHVHMKVTPAHLQWLG